MPTLELIRDKGPDAIRALVPELAADLDAYRVGEREPRSCEFAGTHVVTAAPPSRGGGVITTALVDLDGRPPGVVALAHALAAGYEGEAVATPKLTGTTQISVLDAAGDAVALSSTLGSGSGLFRGGAQLNNMLGELDVIGIGARAPGDRLASMMAPTIVLEDGRPRLALGSAGSVRLAGAIVQAIEASVGRGAPLADAIEGARLHVDAENRVHLEGGRPEADAEDLIDAGLEVVRWAGPQPLLRRSRRGRARSRRHARGGRRPATRRPRHRRRMNWEIREATAADAPALVELATAVSARTRAG